MALLLLVVVTTVQAAPAWYYWSDTETNRAGEDLEECLRKYGTGGSFSREKDMETKVLFLDDSRSDSYSWLLRIRKMSTSEQIGARMYDNKAGVYKKPGRPPHSDGLPPKDTDYAVIAVIVVATAALLRHMQLL